MTFYFPDTPPLFRQAFDVSCDRVLQAESDATFYALLVQFIGYFRESLLLNQYILPLEAESVEKKRIFSKAALEALEDIWQRHWRYHPRLKQRKLLVHIKRMVSAPHGISYTPLYQGILFRMREFCHFSPLYCFMDNAPRLFGEVCSQQRLVVARFEHAYPLGTSYFAGRKVEQRKLYKKDKRWGLHKHIPKLGAKGSSVPFSRSVGFLPAALFSPKVDAVDKGFLICGRNSHEKWQNMQMIAETDFTFCWERLCFIERCYLTEGILREQKSFKGRWQFIREAAWQASQEMCEDTVLLGAKMSLRKKLASESSDVVDSFLRCEDQIHRKDCEKYLLSLKNHVHALLFKIESAWQKAEEHPLLDLPGTQKRAFVIDLAQKFWKANSLGKQDEAYEYYQAHCPYHKLLKRDRWDQIIRDRKLDPRPPEEKRRGRGKKARKN